MDETLHQALTSVAADVGAALASVEAARRLAERGDHDAALEELHLGLGRRLEDAGVAATAAVDRLRDLGGTYLPGPAGGE